jgi:hypothetical protein
VSLHHVALEVAPDGVPAETAFWGLLGWTPVEPPEGLRSRAAWLQHGDQQLHLLLAEAPAVPSGGHVALELGDRLGPVLDALRAGGHPVDERARHWGAERWYATSPAGHRVELMAARPAG